VRINTVKGKGGLFDSVFLYSFVQLTLAGERPEHRTVSQYGLFSPRMAIEGIGAIAIIV
jgi:hypothetical protein